MGHEEALARNAVSPIAIPARGWLEIAKRTLSETSSDNAALIAAGIAFYAFLAMVPMLGALVLIYGLVAEPTTVIKHVTALASFLPSDVAGLVGEQLLNVVKTSDGKKGLGVILALAVAMWGARNAAGAIVGALNIAYEEEERRSFVAVTLLSLVMTLAAIALILVGGGAIAVATQLSQLLPDLGSVGVVLGKGLSYLLIIAIVSAATASLYRYGPCRANAKWRWLTPGSVLFALSWAVLTQAFAFYVANFGDYNLTYGSLGAVMVLLTWLYLSSYVLVVGAELNSEIEHQTARDSTSGPDLALGQRGAWSADHVAEPVQLPDDAQALHATQAVGPQFSTGTGALTPDNGGPEIPSRRSGRDRRRPSGIVVVLAGGILALVLPSLLAKRRS